MKKVLFCGGSHAEVPMISVARNKGWFVITTGNNFDGPGHKISDKYIKGDFSDKEFVLKIAKEEMVEAIVSGCNDFSYLSTAYACEKLGLAGHDTYEKSLIIHHKDKFRKYVKKIGIKSPEIYECYNTEQINDFLQNLAFPVLVKPIDLTGGKGVFLCRSKDELIIKAQEAFEITRQDHIILEEYIEGSNHGASFIIKNHKVKYSVFDDEQYGLNKYLVLGASCPSLSTSEKAKKQLISDINLIVDSLDLVDGLFHVQYIIDHNDYPVIIDPCRRAPGDLYVLLAKYTTGVDYPLEIFNSEIGNIINDNYILENNCIARECIMAEKEGKISHIYIDDLLNKYIIEKNVWGQPGDIINDAMKYKAGILIMKFNTTDEMKQIIDNFSNLAKIVYRE